MTGYQHYYYKSIFPTVKPSIYSTHSAI